MTDTGERSGGERESVSVCCGKGTDVTAATCRSGTRARRINTLLHMQTAMQKSEQSLNAALTILFT